VFNESWKKLEWKWRDFDFGRYWLHRDTRDGKMMFSRPSPLFRCHYRRNTANSVSRNNVFLSRVFRSDTVSVSRKQKREYKLRRSSLGVWHSLHYTVYSLSHPVHLMKSRRMRESEHVARMWEIRNTYKIIIGKRERKRPFRTHGRKWGDNIKAEFDEIGCEDVEWIKLAEDSN
jgi:hypothetical protein